MYCLWYQEFPTPKGAIDKIHIVCPEKQIQISLNIFEKTWNKTLQGFHQTMIAPLNKSTAAHNAIFNS